ncbi:MAG: hypothetical protein NTY47_02340 [Candidatus Omnitrophica bacterium]|nr:hypothetical protein [Candidatus Omnitrophota bacterium]
MPRPSGKEKEKIGGKGVSTTAVIETAEVLFLCPEGTPLAAFHLEV